MQDAPAAPAAADIRAQLQRILESPVFRVRDGLIREFEAYFDPRPLGAAAETHR